MSRARLPVQELLDALSNFERIATDTGKSLQCPRTLRALADAKEALDSEFDWKVRPNGKEPEMSVCCRRNWRLPVRTKKLLSWSGQSREEKNTGANPQPLAGESWTFRSSNIC